MALQFKRAVKREAKGRVALMGPAGSGKSYTMLKLARQLAGPDGKIAAVDTEHGSLSKYADVFDFDVIELDSYSTNNFLGSLHAAEQAGYAVFCCDSLSHFWVGKDGALEFVDNALRVTRARNNGRADDMAGWKEFTPHEREMINAMIASPCHVIVTMRVKTAYEEQLNERTGRKQRVKVGLAPVQRAGLEYEFDLVGAMDEDNTLIIDKCRVVYPDGSSPYAGKAFPRPSNKEFEAFIEWLKGAPADRQNSPTVSDGAESVTTGLDATAQKTAPTPPKESVTRQGTGAAKPAARNGRPLPVESQVDPALLGLWDEATDAVAVRRILTRMCKEIIAGIGEAAAAEQWARLVRPYGGDWRNLSADKAKRLIRDVWAFLQKMEQPPAPAIANDEDVPSVIGGPEVPA